MTTMIVQANGVDLCVETFGRPGDPAILLSGGAAASMDWWEDDFCQQLADGRRFVIRYDNRDTGQSTSYQAGAPPYTGEDLVGDIVGLLDALDVPQAHVVGLSMGGGLAQHLAVHHPDRVSSLTLMSTSPDGPAEPGMPKLPAPTPEVSASFEQPAPDLSDRDAVIEAFVEGERVFESPATFDEAHIRELAGRVVDRTTNVAAMMTNHWILAAGGDPVRPLLGAITAPTLVMHGADDPFLPFPHAEALAAEIPGARLVRLEHVGHQYPPRPVWPVVVPAILEHTSR